jgi:hypothetical protein
MTIVAFDHTTAGAIDCTSCHSNDAPTNHYSSQYSACHTTAGWKRVLPVHTGLIDCISCQSGDAPTPHFPGQCSDCYTPAAGWANYSVYHTGLNACSSCHLKDRPANHNPGQCSNCHSTHSWGDALEIIGGVLFQDLSCSIYHNETVVLFTVQEPTK